MGVVVCRKARQARSPRRPTTNVVACVKAPAASRKAPQPSSSSASWSSRIVDAFVGSASSGWSVEQATTKLDCVERVACGSAIVMPAAVPRFLLCDAQLHDNVHDVTPLELGVCQMINVYDVLVESGSWDALFRRGPRPDASDAPDDDAPASKRKLAHRDETVRSMATTYLSHTATDAWNVLAGAIELARVWGFAELGQSPAVPSPRYTRASEGVDRETRLRLAVCLSVAWKFARSNQAIFYRDFAPGDGGPVRSTLELAFVGYAFLLPHERATLGGWNAENVVALRALQARLLNLEIDLVLGVHTFPLLAENAQLLAERHAQDLFDSGRLSAVRSMQIRGIVPFFLRASLFKRRSETSSLHAELFGVADPEIGARALVCAAWMCVKHAGGPARDMRSARQLFNAIDCLAAWKLLDNAARATTADPVFYKHGCYGDSSWYGYAFVRTSTLVTAMHACMPGVDTDHEPKPRGRAPTPLALPTPRHPNPTPPAGLFHAVTQACLW